MFSISGKIPIRIYPFFWILIGIIGWLNSASFIGTAIWAFVILVSVLVHEFGHALTAVAFGQEASIELIGLGGVTHRQGGKLKFWQEFIIVINGPLAGLLLCLGAYLLLGIFDKKIPNSLFTYMLDITVYANLFWTIVNLLPVHPLDGGRLLSIILESIFGLKGIKIAFLISSILSFIISLLFFSIQGLFAGSLFLLLAFESFRAWKSSLEISTPDQNADLQKLLKQAEDNLRMGHEETAKEQLEVIRKLSREGLIYLTATEYLSSLLNREGNIKEAYEVLVPLQKRLPQDSLRLLHQLAYRNGALRHAVEVGNRLYQLYPSYHTALTNALCYSLLGEVKPALGWLQRAISDGLPNPKIVLDKTEFDSIRHTGDFQQFRVKYIS